MNSKEPSGLLWIFSHPIFYTRKPEELQIILLNKNSLGKGYAYRFCEPLNLSILCTDGKSISHLQLCTLHEYFIQLLDTSQNRL